jgi:hypothetical protein
MSIETTDLSVVTACFFHDVIGSRCDLRNAIGSHSDWLDLSFVMPLSGCCPRAHRNLERSASRNGRPVQSPSAASPCSSRVGRSTALASAGNLMYHGLRPDRAGLMMRTSITIPKLGWAMKEGTLSEWLVEDGAQVLRASGPEGLSREECVGSGRRRATSTCGENACRRRPSSSRAGVWIAAIPCRHPRPAAPPASPVPGDLNQYLFVL